jgi:hypothetical protein
MIVREYRPDGSRNDRPLRQQKVEVPTDALFIDWVRRKGGEHVEEHKSGEYWFVLSKAGWVIALVFKE